MRRSDLLAFLLLSSLGIAFLAPSLFTDAVFMPAHTRQFLPARDHVPKDELQELDARANLAMTDKLFMFHPEVQLTRDSLAAGELPAWNPYMLGGVPHLEQQVPAVYSPLVALTLIMDPLEAWGWIAALHIALAGILTYAYLRAVSVSPLPAIFGALAFALSGWMTSRLHYYQITGASIWLPAALLGIEGMVRGRKLLGALLIALAIGLAFVAGFPQVAVLTVYVVAAYAGFRALSILRWRGAGEASFLLVVAASASILGLGLSAAQVYPAAEFAYSGESSRGTIDEEQFLDQRLRPQALLGLLSPEVFGTPLWSRRLHSAVVSSESLLQHTYLRQNFVEITGYVGILPLLLGGLGAVLAIGKTRAFAHRFLAVLCIVSFTGILWAPLLRLLHQLPGMDFGDPKRYYFLITFSLCGLSAFGLQHILSRTRRSSASILLAILAAALAGIAVWIWLQPGDALRDRLHRWIAESPLVQEYKGGEARAEDIPEMLGQYGVPPEDVEANVELLRSAGLRTGLLSTLTAAVLAGLAFTGSSRRRLIACAAIGLALFDLGSFGAPLNRSMPGEGFYESTSLSRFLQENAGVHRIYRFSDPQRELAPYWAPLMPDFAMVHRLQDAQGYITLTVKRYEEYVEAIQKGRMRAGGGGVLPLTDPAALDSRLLDLLGVRYILSSEQVGIPGLGDPVLQDGITRVYENPGVLPRALLVRGARYAATPRQAYEMISAPGFDPSRTVVVEGELVGQWPVAAEPASEGEARIERYTPRTVEIEVSPVEPSILVLSDTFLQGWKVYVDDEERRLLRVDYAFRGVMVGPADREVRFRYSPSAPKTGLMISAAASAIWAIGLLVACTSGRRRA